MNQVHTLLIAGLALVSSTSLHAQDLFGSANSATRSYNYFEIQYLPGEDDTEVPLAATLVVGVTDHWSVWSQYLKYDVEDAGELFGLGSAIDAEVSASILALGLLYHSPFQLLADTDWVAGFALARLEVEVDIPALLIQGESKSTLEEAYLGIRRTLAPKLEAEIGLDVIHDDGDFTTTGNLKAVYRVLPAVDIALGLTDIGEEDILGIGFRFVW